MTFAPITPEALSFLRPGEAWSLSGPSHDDLDWLEPGKTKPTREEIESAQAALARMRQAAAVKAEYQRRLIVLLGATDLGHAAYIRADDADEMWKLAALASRTTPEQARLDELRARRGRIEALNERYNTIDGMDPIPADLAADETWSFPAPMSGRTDAVPPLGAGQTLEQRVDQLQAVLITLLAETQRA